jgi:hypothetical protein
VEGETRRLPGDEGFVAALRRVLNILQEMVDRRFEELRRVGTCSREFLEFIDKLEERAVSEMIAYGFRRVNIPSPSKADIVLALFSLDNLLVEVGLKDLNKCGVLEEITGGKPPRVYARLYIGGKAALVLEAEEGRRKEREETRYIM